MIYDTVEIRQRMKGKCITLHNGIIVKEEGGKTYEWVVGFYKGCEDRVKTKINPNSMGYYHYDKKLGRKKAFNQLKSLLIKNHEEEIARLSRSLFELRKLEV